MKLWFALFSMATFAVAQTPSSSIVGRVTDPTGAVLGLLRIEDLASARRPR